MEIVYSVQHVLTKIYSKFGGTSNNSDIKNKALRKHIDAPTNAVVQTNVAEISKVNRLLETKKEPQEVEVAQTKPPNTSKISENLFDMSYWTSKK